jgi:hypothetical protein
VCIELLGLFLETLKEFELLTHVVDKRLYVPVLHDFLVEEVLPNPIEVELTSLDLAIDRFVNVHPELLQELQTVSELKVRPVNHIEHYFVLIWPINEVMEPSPKLFDGHPCHPLAFLPQLLLSLFALEVKHLLVLEVRDYVKVGFGRC